MKSNSALARNFSAYAETVGNGRVAYLFRKSAGRHTQLSVI